MNDDVAGKLLNSDRLRAPTVDERDGVYKRNVFIKAAIQQCYSDTGVPPISTKWVDEGDDDDPDYRSRWVGRQFKGGDKDRVGLFAATPTQRLNAVSLL